MSNLETGAPGAARDTTEAAMTAKDQENDTNPKTNETEAAAAKSGNGDGSTTTQPGPATGEGDTQPGAKAAEIDKVGVLGHAIWLMTHTPTHKHLFIADMEWLLIPPVSLGQFRIWRKDRMPLAFATWAFLSDDVAERFKSGAQRIAPKEWKSGDQLWLMDLIAPFGGAEAAAKEMKEQVFGGRPIRTLRPSFDGKGMAVVEW